MIAAKHFDPVMGVDIHIIQPPGPVPPVPVPHPFVGMLVDPTEYAPIIGGTVKINGMMRGVAGTGGKAVPPHIPIGGVFVMPPGNECEMFMGSATVAIDGDPQSRLGDPALSCQSVGMPSIPRLKMHARPKTLMLPTSVVLAVPMGPPVMVGGPPTISLSGMAMKFGMAALGKAMKKLKKLQKASKKWKAVSDKMKKAADKVLDNVPGGQKLKGKAHNAICSLTGHPVDVASGKVTTESTDVELPGPLPFTFSRVWYSQSDYQGPLGHGWHHSYDLGLYSFPEGMVLRLTDGRFVVFQPPVPGEPSFDRTEKLFLHMTEKGYHAETLDGLVYQFGWPNPNGDELPLAHVRDPNDNRIVLERDRGKLVAFIDSGGRRLPVTTDAAGRITEIRVPDPDKPGDTFPMVTYQYDRRCDLVRVDDALGHPFKYEYLDHLLVRETDRSGLAFYFMYDGSGPDAKCLRTWGDGDLFLRDLVYDDARQRTEATNSLGHKTVYEWNDAGLVVKETDPLGGATLTEWSPFNDRLSTTNPNGEKTEFVYDEFGRLAGVIDPTGAAVAYEYDAAGNAVTLTDPNGSVWAREYDARRNVTAVVDPLGNRSEFAIDRRGMPTAATDPLGYGVRLEWTAAGQLARVVDRTGAVDTFAYDLLGRVRERSAAGGRTRYEYDRRGLRTATTDPAGRRYEVGYNADGDPRRAVDPLGRVTELDHGLIGRRLAVRSPGGAATRYRYDTEGLLVGVDGPGQERWEYSRDANGNVTEQRTPDGRVLRYRYDPAGRVAESVNARGQAQTFARDKAGRLTARRSVGVEEVFAYDASGRMTRAANASAAVNWSYDPLGRVRAETQNGATVGQRFDAVGNRVARTSPLGSDWGFEYDPEGRLNGLRSGDTPLFRSRLDEGGHEVRREAGGCVWEWERGTHGLPAAVRVTGREAIRRTYTYDPTDTPTGQADSTFGEESYTHDADGRLVAVRRGEVSRQFRYDAGGNLRPQEGVRVRRDADGNVIEKRDGDRVWRFEYDPFGRLTAAEGDGVRSAYAYDPLGRRVRKTVDGRAIDYLWDGDVLLGHRGGGQAAEYVFRPGTFEPVAVRTAAGVGLIECDPVGLPRSAFNPDGEKVWHASFEAFGRVRAEDGAAGLVGVRYPGQLADAETGLSYNWHRYLDPDAGSYLSPDPVGYYVGGSVWDYVPSPYYWADPLGLERGLWELGPMSSETKVIGNRTYHKHSTTGLWWSKDTAGHGGSAFKVFTEGPGGTLNWHRDADKYGDYIDPTKKHKGPKGKKVCG